MTPVQHPIVLDETLQETNSALELIAEVISGTVANAVHYTVDEDKSASEKAQARDNIGVYSRSEVDAAIAEAVTAMELRLMAKINELEELLN